MISKYTFMKKTILSFAFILAFAGYTGYHYLGNTPNQALMASQPILPPRSTSTQGQVSGSANSRIVSKPSRLSGQFKDGTYIGSVADAYYGNVQVEAVVSGGRISDVKFLQYPSDRSTSRFINGQAMPILASEAVQSQKANVDIVSGATDTSAAFQQSLMSAISQAQG